MNWNAPINSWWRSHVTLRTLYLLFLGQLVSFTLALMSFTSSLIADLGIIILRPFFNVFIKSCSSSLVSFNDNGFSLRCMCLLGVDAPVTQSAFAYFSLALVYGGVLLYRRQRLRVIIHFFDYLAYEVINKTYRLGGSNLDRY